MSAATEMLTKYIAAEAAILSGQEMRWGDRTLKRADLGMIQQGRKEWQLAVDRETAAAAKTNKPIQVVL